MRKMKESFSRFFSKNEKIKKTFISVVALIIALVISVSTVSAWVETISTIKIIGSGKIDTPITTSAVIKSTSGESIDLKKYFRKAGNVHLSVASSADGNDFYFPVASSTGSTAYRKGTVNDENVNYIKFSLNVSSSDSKDYGYQLSQVPVIKIGDTIVENSAVRIAVTDETAGTTALMSKVGTTAQVVVATDGTKGATTVKTFTNYVDNDIFTIKKGETHKITVKMWLQDGALSNYDVSGSTVEVSNFILEPSIPKYVIKAIAVTNGTSQSATGGTVQVGSATAGATSQEEVNDGGSVTLKAVAKSGYKFLGWYSAASDGSTVSGNSTFTLTNITKANTVYARFVTAYTAKAIAVTDGGQSSNGGTVLVGSKTSYAATSTDTIATGTSTTFKAKISNSTNYRFDGWYTGQTTGTKVSSSTSYSTTITANTTLYARFISQYTVTAHAVTDGTLDSSTGGTVKIGSGTAGASATTTVDKGSSVTLTASAKDGYTFEGWYDAQTGGTQKSTSASYTISSISATQNLYARFKTKAKTLDVGVVYYLKENSTITQVYYWCDDNTNGTINLSDCTETTRNYAVGSSYWNNAAQKFYCYKIEVPNNVTGIKFRNGNNWYGGDVKNFESGKIDLIFEYSGTYHNYRATY